MPREVFFLVFSAVVSVRPRLETDGERGVEVGKERFFELTDESKLSGLNFGVAERKFTETCTDV